jgi:hypothetical protein
MTSGNADATVNNFIGMHPVAVRGGRRGRGRQLIVATVPVAERRRRDRNTISATAPQRHGQRCGQRDSELSRTGNGINFADNTIFGDLSGLGNGANFIGNNITGNASER